MAAVLRLFRAILVRVMFTAHGLVSIWHLCAITHNRNYWYITSALGGLMVEAVFTIYKKRGHDWKWFCPSVMFYLLCVVPTIWFLELHLLEMRLTALKAAVDPAFNLTRISPQFNESTNNEQLTAFIADLLKIPIHVPPMSSDQWVKALEQILLLFLILGRWMLPKGKLSHDQLSQLLLVYIGTAGDIVELFEAFKEEAVRTNRVLCIVILSIWSWSLLQYTMVLTATKARKDKTGLLPNLREDSDLYSQPGQKQQKFVCCTPDVYGVIISICMQDIPFLSLRLVLIFKYEVVSYTNMFFTCKNTLVCSLLAYRLVVVQIERRRLAMRRFRQWASIHTSHSNDATSSVARLVTMAKSASSIASSATAILRHTQSAGQTSTWQQTSTIEDKSTVDITGLQSTVTTTTNTTSTGPNAAAADGDGGGGGDAVGDSGGKEGETEGSINYVIRRHFSQSMDEELVITSNISVRDDKQQQQPQSGFTEHNDDQQVPVVNYVIKRHF